MSPVVRESALHCFLRARGASGFDRIYRIHLMSIKRQSMDSASAIAVLTAMITPAVLISACGSMILSTSSRLGRVVDRVRVACRIAWRTWPRATKEARRQLERQASIFQQLDKLTSRARLLQRCMVTFYLSLGMFVATSVAIGIVAFTGNPTLQPRAGGARTRRRMLSFLRQRAADLRSATGAEHDSR